MARYKALSDGIFHKPVSVTRNGETLHKDYIIAGDEFEFDGVKGSWMEEIKVKEPEEPSTDNREEIIAELKELGISFHHRTSTDKLQQLLDEAKEA